MNYRDWCEAMRVVPQFMDPAQGNEIDGSTYTEVRASPAVGKMLTNRCSNVNPREARFTFLPPFM